MIAIAAVIYFAVLGVISWNNPPTHWLALLFIGLALLALSFVWVVPLPYRRTPPNV